MLNDPLDKLTLTAIAPNPTQGRWRTEAMRSHSNARLFFFARGQGRITVAGLTRGYGANNLIYVPPNTMYGFEVGPTVFGQMITIPSAMEIEWPETMAHLRLRDVVTQKELSAHLDVLERELKSELPGAQRAAHYQLGLLAIFFERRIAAHQEDNRDIGVDTASAKLVAAYTDLIENHYHEHIGVAKFAALLGVTPTHLTRCCKETSGQSALMILNNRILFEARLRLRETRTPVCDIAGDLGFGSAAYFTRAFQTETGMTPTAFRKKGPLSAL